MKAILKGFGILAPRICGLLFFVFLTEMPLASADDWTPSTSDENGDNSPAHCDNGLVTGLKCTGKYCDNTALKCSSEGIIKETRGWSPSLSDENADGFVCPNDEFVQALRCHGKYCDNVSVQCAAAPEVNRDACYWTKGMSEEDGGVNDFGRETYLKGLRCRGKYCDSKEALVCKPREKVCESDECKADLARRFAPVLKFDASQELPNKCFPSDAGNYWSQRNGGNNDRVCNESPDSLNGGQIPIYYAYDDCSGDSTVIMYWFFYGFQDTCSPGAGSHAADWERVAVRIKDGQLQRVLYFQHGGSYTRQGSDMEVIDGTHPVAYVGKNSHGSYHDQGGSGSCLYFEDYRNTGDKGYTLHTQDNLIALGDSDSSPEWMKSWDAKNFDGIPGPLRRGINLCSMPGCEGKDAQMGALCFGQCGCSKSSIGDSPF